jgi:hypothetical protein
MKTRGHVMARHANRRWRTLGAGAGRVPASRSCAAVSPFLQRREQV